MSENTFTMKSWTENVVSGPEDGPRFAHASATFEYTGVIEGTGVCDYLMYYAGEGYVGAGQTSPGFERIEGGVDGRRGSFVIRHDVGYGPDGVEGTWRVVPGSGTGELAGLTGTGTIAGSSETMAYTFDYALS
ncbi:Protein of unknown function [Amycolatopsis arida]|uniref:DUF3224 domain-containing protein n=1 Tax=Amycolatopsis arida TaxID=587909 RepID=A0A1I5WCQ4_9PSEU|nr:DUF3224 domain-containing protein [Amycolatopsis arida]TDX92219.1 uncharacterized protein DUF3224 [Amycolatopsis arida]SFQ17500.1 Protein of unknown function [Amycolatopsis arida]